MYKCLKAPAILVLALGVSSVYAGDWDYGIGLGFGALDVNGDGGFNTKVVGPVEFDASMDPSDVMDYLDSGINLGGFARNGDYTITFAYSNISLKGDVTASKGPVKGKLDLTFDAVVAEVLVKYAFSRSQNSTWSAVGGLRYSDQEYDAELKIGNIVDFNGTVSDSWTDAVVGIAHTYAFSPSLAWTNQIDYGFGGSEGTAHFKSGIDKVFAENWLFGVALDVKDVEYEEGKKGDKDWYFYDATETSLGVSVTYLF